MRYALLLTLAVCLAAGTSVAKAVEAPTDLQTEVTALKARIAEMEGQKSQQWLTERRAEQVKDLIRDVLADADTRASLLEGGLTAGHNGQNFFLASEDGGFLLNIGGQIQLRYIANSRDGSADDGEAGFVIERAKVQLSGHVADPRISYKIQLAINDDTNNVSAEKAVISYALSDGVTLWAGDDKAPFLREETVDSSHQTAVERSLVSETYTAGLIQGIGLAIDISDDVKAQVALSDGAQSAEGAEDFDHDNSDIAVTARLDLKSGGSWAQADDFAAWSGEDTIVLVGAAIHWEEAETGNAGTNDSMTSWTIDAALETGGLSLFLAISGVENDNEVAADTDSYGYVIQGGYMVIPDTLEPFVRWEHLDLDDDTGGEVDILTFGANLYNDKHNSKLTVDVIWVLDDEGLTGLNTAHGLLGDAAGDDDDQIALRIQYQLLF